MTPFVASLNTEVTTNKVVWPLLSQSLVVLGMFTGVLAAVLAMPAAVALYRDSPLLLTAFLLTNGVLIPSLCARLCDVAPDWMALFRGYKSAEAHAFLEQSRVQLAEMSEGPAPNVHAAGSAFYMPRFHRIGIPVQMKTAAPAAVRALLRHELEHGHQAQRTQRKSPVFVYPEEVFAALMREISRCEEARSNRLGLGQYSPKELRAECEADAAGLAEAGQDWRWYRTWHQELNRAMGWDPRRFELESLRARRRHQQLLARHVAQGQPAPTPQAEQDCV